MTTDASHGAGEPAARWTGGGHGVIARRPHRDHPSEHHEADPRRDPRQQPRSEQCHRGEGRHIEPDEMDVAVRAARALHSKVRCPVRPHLCRPVVAEVQPEDGEEHRSQCRHDEQVACRSSTTLWRAAAQQEEHGRDEDDESGKDQHRHRPQQWARHHRQVPRDRMKREGDLPSGVAGLGGAAVKDGVDAEEPGADEGLDPQPPRQLTTRDDLLSQQRDEHNRQHDQD